MLSEILRLGSRSCYEIVKIRRWLAEIVKLSTKEGLSGIVKSENGYGLSRVGNCDGLSENESLGNRDGLHESVGLGNRDGISNIGSSVIATLGTFICSL